MILIRFIFCKFLIVNQYNVIINDLITQQMVQ